MSASAYLVISKNLPHQYYWPAMSVRRKHETLPPRLKLKGRYPIEEINIEARKNREEGINGVLRLWI